MRPTEVSVTFRRTRQPQQYETAEASVSVKLVADEGEVVADLDAAIREALDVAQGNVFERLGLKAPAPRSADAAPVKASPAKEPAARSRRAADVAPTKEAPAAAAEPAASAAAPAKEPEPEAAPAADIKELPPLTDGDLNKAIAQTMQRLTKAGVSNGGQRIIEKIKAYLPDTNPPFSPGRIPATARRDFVKDLEELQ